MERRESIEPPIKLGEIYSINLNQLRAKLLSNGTGMKMRRFFVSPNWDNEICAVGASSGGGKGGVLFLYKYLNPQNKAQGPEDSPAYAIKLTDSPQQVLFAEHVLRNYGRFKVPKSLAVFLDWEVWPENLNSDLVDGDRSDDANARKLVSLVIDANKRHENTAPAGNGRNTNFAADHYEENVSALRGKTAQYLLIMKCFRIASFDAANSFKYEHVVENPFLDANNPAGENSSYKAYSLSSADREWRNFHEGFNESGRNRRNDNDNNNNNDSEDDDGNDNNNNDLRLGNNTKFNQLTEPLRERPEIKKMIWGIILNKYILSDEYCMQQTGELLFWDLLLGNGDRVQSQGGANVGNFFFTNKRYYKAKDKGKRKKPIALIDNDCFLTEYNPSAPGIAELKRENLEDYVSAYLTWVLIDGAELKPNNNDIGDNSIHGIIRPSVKYLLQDFDDKVFKDFVRTFIPWKVPSETVEIIKDLYEDTGTLLGMDADTYPGFSDDLADESWALVKRNLKIGFITAAESFFHSVGAANDSLYQEHELKLTFYDLLKRYGSSLNFDYRAFEATRFYLQSMLAGRFEDWKESPSLAIDEANEQSVFQTIARFLMGTDIHKINEDLQACIEFGKSNQWINEEKARALRVAIQLLHPNQQQEILVGKNSRLSKSRKGRRNNNNNNIQVVENKRNDRLKAVRFLLVCIYLNQYDPEGVFDGAKSEIALSEIRNHMVSLGELGEFWKKRPKTHNKYQFLVERLWAMSQAGSAATLLKANALFDAVKALFSDL